MTAAAETAETNKKKRRQCLIFPVWTSNNVDKSLRWLNLAAAATMLVSGVICCCSPAAAASSGNTVLDQITKGFSIAPSSSSSRSSFQPILKDPSGNFSFGFLFLRSNQLDLAVVYLPSSFTLWRANATRAQTAPTTILSFDGRLLLSDTRSGTLYWSPQAKGLNAHSVVLLNTSNLQIRTRSGDILWQSFDFPSDTIVQDQNFTSDARLHDASNNGFSMRLGPNYLGLFFMVRIMYWKQTAFEARAEILDGKGPIYARINTSQGYMAMYQQEGPPVHVIPFDSYNRNITAVYFRRLTLESDGNLRGYYWNGISWVSDFKAIPNRCDLPTACGSYALCTQKGTAGTCSSLQQNDDDDNERCLPQDKSDLCAPTGGASSGYRELRRTGVELAYKEFMKSTKADFLEDCESSCRTNCSCWGAIYSNATGACYKMDFPVETLVVGEGKMGYFKMRMKAGRSGGDRKMAAGIAILLVVGLAIFIGIAIIAAYRAWRWGWSRSRTTTQGSLLAEGLAPLPYKDLKQTSSFRSVELSVPPPRQ